MQERVTVGLIGLGAMGRIHAENLAALPEARLLAVASRREETGRAVAAHLGVPRVYDDYAALLADEDIKAVVIAAATPEHAGLVTAAAEAGKAIFCEKPVALTLEKMDAVLAAVKKAGVPFQIGFMRRFDAAYMEAKRRIEAGAIGQPVLFRGTSRDPCLPAPEDKSALARGSLFIDLGIHDYDMARWLMDDEVVEVYATGAALVYPQLREFGDLDNGLVFLRFAGGGLGCIDLSRNARYGYDVRTEVLGSEGGLQIGELERTPLRLMSTAGVCHDTYPWYPERFAAAYREELRHFLLLVQGEAEARATGEDGRAALAIALAVVQSFRSGQPVRLGE